MKLKLDENLPLRAASRLTELGLDVDTAVSEGLSGADDHEVLRAATEAGRLLITLDREFGDIRAYPPGSHRGVLVIRAEDRAPEPLTEMLEVLVRQRQLGQLDGAVAVFRKGILRVRRVSGAAARDI